MVLSCCRFSMVLSGSVGSRRFSVVLIDSRWFSVVLPVGSRRFSMVLVGSQWFLVVLVRLSGSLLFSLVLVGSQWFSVVLVDFQLFS